MKRLILFRHAKSDWPGGVDDIERPLAERGRMAAPLMGRYLRDEGLLPDLALVSPALRTRETWDLASAELGETIPVRIEPRIYEAPPGQLLQVVHEIDDAVRAAILVGHNPGSHELATTLAGFGDRYAFARLAQKYPTAGVTVLDFDVEGWRNVARRGGRLDRFVTPKTVGAERDDD
ncbi:MAG: histidine phosphatase family protein [Salinarimonadaceae bacterium]|nr:MAG: histidine phosphatase family protein [Salinarimonadaceae bacterium]